MSILHKSSSKKALFLSTWSTQHNKPSRRANHWKRIKKHWMKEVPLGNEKIRYCPWYHGQYNNCSTRWQVFIVISYISYSCITLRLSTRSYYVWYQSKVLELVIRIPPMFGCTMRNCYRGVSHLWIRTPVSRGNFLQEYCCFWFSSKGIWGSNCKDASMNIPA